MRFMLPSTRWALTPPFHPYLSNSLRRFFFCGAFRRVTPPGRYPAPSLCGVRTFLEVKLLRDHSVSRILAWFNCWSRFRQYLLTIFLRPCERGQDPIYMQNHHHQGQFQIGLFRDLQLPKRLPVRNYPIHIYYNYAQNEPGT